MHYHWGFLRTAIVVVSLYTFLRPSPILADSLLVKDGIVVTELRDKLANLRRILSQSDKKVVSVSPNIGLYWFDFSTNDKIRLEENYDQLTISFMPIFRLGGLAVRFDDEPALAPSVLPTGSRIIVFNSLNLNDHQTIDNKLGQKIRSRIGREAAVLEKKRCHQFFDVDHDVSDLIRDFYIYWDASLRGYEIGDCILEGLFVAFGLDKNVDNSGSDFVFKLLLVQILARCVGRHETDRSNCILEQL